MPEKIKKEEQGGTIKDVNQITESLIIWIL